jgi:cytochrome c peroxidase
MLRFMQRLVAVGAVLALVTACTDAPTDIGTDEQSLFKKGGNKPGGGGGQVPDAVIALGEFAFTSKALSVNGTQACETCHDPRAGFAAAFEGANTVGGVVQGALGALGDRKPPSAAYSSMIPNFGFSGRTAVGGHFWDGRGTGDLTGTAAGDQALGPFLNPKEQALPDAACVVRVVAGATFEYLGKPYTYADAWPDDDIGAIVFPQDIDAYCSTPGAPPLPEDDIDRAKVTTTYYNIARSIAAFEATFNVFDSKFDRGSLDETELLGQQLFGGKGKCQQCHDNKGDQPLFTDFEFHNLGVPVNPENPTHYFQSGTFDEGLGGAEHVGGDPRYVGKFKTPTVRNVGENAAYRTYMHNGALVSLTQVVQFYNTRDVLPVCDEEHYNEPTDDRGLWGPGEGKLGCWPPPEYGDNLDTKNMGNLGLTDEEVAALVAYMMAMTDLSEPPYRQ